MPNTDGERPFPHRVREESAFTDSLMHSFPLGSMQGLGAHSYCTTSISPADDHTTLLDQHFPQ